VTNEEILAARELAESLFDFDESSPINDEALQLVQTLFSESDRGAVLVAAALLDDALEDLVRSVMSNQPDVVKKAVDPLLKSPIRSFWAKTQLAYALQLIDSDLYDALNDIRGLRNAFAHRTAPASLSDTQVAQLVQRLKLHFSIAARAVGAVCRNEIAKTQTVAPDARIPRGLTPERMMFTMAAVIVSAETSKGQSCTSGIAI
jgi:DNA-binding MltR family transcriptional regulator